MNHLHVLKKMHDERIKYNKNLLSILSSINKDVKEKLNTEYSHDMTNFFNKQKIDYIIRESTDRLYVIDLHENTMNRDEIIKVNNDENNLIENAIIKETTCCQHNIVTDLIDIDPDRSMIIKYCDKCEETFH